ncbi:Peroxisome assembly protein 12 [Pleurostoma richardsiae]|uniref:Peroxisome assembly protein 12 n=1 Tax=Pleurostoma richardsiae TaxID=41990 RepID=A0AA38VS26_9PEZI|nr:Peroxisome assembly protein 12 [Pleurostoma richardsiae]
MEFVTALRASEAFDDAKPSLFELLSEQQLSSLLPPTLRYLLTLATERHPRYLLRALNSFDEIYALAMLLVERHHLRTRGGSFTEHFYGLKRERVPAVPAIPRASSAAPALASAALRLSDADVWRALAVLVGAPYLKRKLEEAHERDAPRALLGAAYDRLPARPSLRDRAAHFWRWLLRRVYPGLSAAWGLAALAFQMAYLFGGSGYHGPLGWMVGQRVRRMTGADYAAIEAAAEAGKKARAGGLAGTALSPRGVAGRALGSLSVLLPVSIFALKFLEWWHASDFARQLSRRAAESLDLPPPVVSGLGEAAERKRKAAAGDEKETAGEGGEEEGNDKDEEGVDEYTLVERAPVATPSLLPILTVPAPADSALCPICGDEIATATACQTGVVYCYVCIHKWVGGTHPKQEEFMAGRAGKWESGEGRCAVTGRRVLGGTEGLRRIMV